MTAQVSDADKAYLAGLIDGDGSIFISERKSEAAAYHHGRFRLFVSISNCNKDLLEVLSKLWDRSIIYWQSKNYHAGRITWEGPKAKMLLNAVYPYLIGKKDQATLALTFPCEGRGLFTSEGQERQKYLHAQIRELNRKWSMGKTRKEALCSPKN